MRIILIFIIVFAGNCLQAQNYNWFQAGFGYTTSKSCKVGGADGIYNTPDPDGAFYNFLLRKDISQMTSIETGFMERGYMITLGVAGNNYVSFGASEAYQIPLKIFFDLNLYKDKIFMYTSFGYLFCIEDNSGSGEVISTGFNTDSIAVAFRYLPGSKFHSLYTVSTGFRLRIVDELFLQLELGYAFGFEDIMEFEITYYDDSGVLKEISMTDRGRYWFLGIGLSYPLERVLELMQ